jgi:hypothetical protein
MASDASELLGVPQVAGSKVNPIGSARRRARASGAGVGIIPMEIAGKLMFGKKSKGLKDDQTPDFGGLGYLAASETELVIISTGTKKGVSVTLKEVVARIPRSEVASAEMNGVMIGKLVIGFHDNTQWAFEVPTPNKKDARSIVELMPAGAVGSVS